MMYLPVLVLEPLQLPHYRRRGSSGVSHMRSPPLGAEDQMYRPGCVMQNWVLPDSSAGSYSMPLSAKPEPVIVCRQVVALGIRDL
jgi:hypothetical protein